MASSHIVSKTIELHEKRDPVRNLWRNVLIVAIEDLLKKKEIHIKYNNKKYSLEEMWLHHEDFNLVCEWAQFEPKIIRKRIYEAIQKIERKYENKKNMPKMPWKRLYQSEGIHRESDGNHTPVSTM